MNNHSEFSRTAPAISLFSLRLPTITLAITATLFVTACEDTRKPIASEGEPLTDCRVTDGDTISCGQGEARERIRFLGIDTPELPGHCRKGRDCVAGDPKASKRSLEAVMIGKQLSIERVGTDRYGRTLGIVFADGENLSCYQLANGGAKYVGKWDNGGRVADACPSLAE